METISGSKKANLSKNMQRKLRRLQEEEEKKKLRVEVMETLQKHKLADDKFELLQPSGTLGQDETMKEKLKRAMNYKRAGLPVPADIPLFRERSAGLPVPADIPLFREKPAGLPVPADIPLFRKRPADLHLDQDLVEEEPVIVKKGKHASKSLKRKKFSVGIDEDIDIVEDSKKRFAANNSESVDKAVAAVPAVELKDEAAVAVPAVELKDEAAVAVPAVEVEDILPSLRPQDMYLKEALDTQAVKADLKLRKVVVPISRPDDVVKGRENLPIVMMEQEIMEAISGNDVVIVCGETGCGKTTQVPQFLFEAGFGSSLCPDKSGVIGVTQPRRVAVLATAKRVAYEMNVALGQEVGFQVRHDRKIGNKSCIKFMTDGILLREVQADFLLQKYSIIVLDEAHERSLNTDILIGMLSRILPLRKKLYEKRCKEEEQLRSIGGTSSQSTVMPLKLVIMSATLRIEDFTSNRRMFSLPPPVIQVPARQFPVTVHFSAKTDMIDYVGRAQKKVCAIHRKLPPGGILVFLTGQREVEYLCRKLRRAFKPKNIKEQPQGLNAESEACAQKADVQGLTLESISNAMDAKSGGGDNSGLGGIAEADENDGEKDEDRRFSDSDDENIDGDDDEDSLTDSDEEELVNLQSSLDAVEDNNKTAVDADRIMTDPVQAGSVSGSGDCLKEKRDQSIDPGPLYVLPLYAMLPAAAQLRVFAQVPEGARLVVVATNVAETSITIPGIRYVVDTGRSKERDFDRVNGMSKYEVRWISKASANQRAGRAGRTGPGHCYRLYSSAVFNNVFPKFAPPEMSTAPIEGVVLVMKRMGIAKVVNFPFPTPPERQALVEAERCLRALSALDSDTGNLTPIGKAMAVYPISPRHARMILAALHASQGMGGKGHIILAFAVAAAAALSLENPFLRESGVDAEDSPAVAAQALDKKSKPQAATDTSGKLSKKKGEGDNSEFTEEEKKKRKQRRAEAGRAHGKFRNTHSDALSVVNALWAYEKAENRDQFCEVNYLHAKTMQEMAKLRQQLSQLVVQYSLDASAQSNEQCDRKDGSGLTKEYLLECERVWHCKDQVKLNMNQEMVLQQTILAGWADRVAHRLGARERALIVEEDGKRKAIRYQACAVEETVFLHPASALAREAPEFVVYNEIISTGRPYMWGVTGVQASWLVSHATPLCTFSKPVADPPPWYDLNTDTVMCWVLPSFGPHLWELPPHRIPLKNSKARAAVFAAALLEGKVLPSFSSLLPYLAADPTIILKPESHGQLRVGELLHKLGTGLNVVDSRQTLAAAWQRDPLFLYAEVLAWVQSKAHAKFKQIWSQGQKEASMEGALIHKPAKKKKH